VAVSNGNADIHRVGLGDYFVGHVGAREVGVAKPHPGIYHQAVARARAQAHEVMHVGDDPVLDVVAARRAGLGAAWLNRHGRAWDEAAAPRACGCGGDMARALHAHAVQPQPHERPHAELTDLHALVRLLGL
jgi:putative hydrolase of the HAD superfamily